MIKLIRFSQILGLVLGLFLTTATQIRLPNGPVGVGEVLLVVWMFWELILLLKRKSILMTSMHVKSNVLYVCTAICLILGNLIGFHSSRLGQDEFFRNLFAFLFVSVFSFFFAQKIQEKDFYETFLVWFSSASVIVLFFIFLYSKYSETIGSIVIYSGRFHGLSKNPNQLALLLLPIPFLCFIGFLNSQTNLKKWFFSTLTVLCVVVGVASQSDALMLSWFFGVCIVFLSYWVNKAAYYKRVDNVKYFFVSFFMPMVLYVVLGFAFLFYQEDIYGKLNQTYGKGDQGSVRIQLWENGVRAWKDSPFFGFGLGAFSGIDRPFEGEESHNTFIEWATNAGVFGLVVYGIFLFLVFGTVVRGNAIAFGMLVALVVFSGLHYVFRQPIFWVTVFLALGTAPIRIRFFSLLPRRHFLGRVVLSGNFSADKSRANSNRSVWSVNNRNMVSDREEF